MHGIHCPKLLNQITFCSMCKESKYTIVTVSNYIYTYQIVYTISLSLMKAPLYLREMYFFNGASSFNK